MTRTRKPSTMNPSETAERPDDRGISHEEIAERAYALYLAKGAQDGHDQDDWLEAERMVSERNKEQTATTPQKGNGHALPQPKIASGG